MKKNLFVTLMLVILLVLSVGLTELYVVTSSSREEEKAQFHIVTSFYPMYVACANLVDGVEGISLNCLSEPQTGCLHDYQLTPADLKLLSTADAFVVNGAGMESFLLDVAKEYPSLAQVDATGDMLLLDAEGHEDIHEEEEESHEDESFFEHTLEAFSGKEDAHEHNHDHEENGHVWMSIADYRLQVDNIATALAQLDPDHESFYRANAIVYDEKLAALEEREKALAKATEGESVITLHAAYAYIANDLGWKIEACLDLDEEDQVSALSGGDIAEIVNLIKDKNIKVILVEERYGKATAETIEKETGVTPVYLDTCNRGDYSKESYLTEMENNLSMLEAAFQISTK